MADDFNMSLRKFLKQVGITSQREIEAAVRAAKADGRLPSGPLEAKVTLTVADIDLSHEVHGRIETGEG